MYINRSPNALLWQGWQSRCHSWTAPSETGAGKQTSSAAPLRLGCSSRKQGKASSPHTFWNKPMLFLTASFLLYLSVHEVVLKLEMSFSLLVNAAQILLTNRDHTGVEICTLVAIVIGETSSLLPWLFFTFIAGLLNVKYRRGPKSKVHSPNMSSTAVRFFLPQSCIS